MAAFVFLRVQPGKVEDVGAQIQASKVFGTPSRRSAIGTSSRRSTVRT